MTAELRIPRVGCGAAVLREGRLLLVQRRRPPEAGHWGLPGGKVDWLEPLPQAVAREIEEELGLSITPRDLLCMVDQIDREMGDHWVSPVYVIEDAVGEPAIREPAALAGCGWFSLDALPEPLTLATRTAVRALALRARPGAPAHSGTRPHPTL